MSYGANIPDLFRRAADYVDQILKWREASRHAGEQPTKFDLVINLKTAKALGLDMPPPLLARADEVIEWVRQAKLVRSSRWKSGPSKG